MTAVYTTNGGTPYYNSAVQVDGSGVTPEWQGGAPLLLVMQVQTTFIHIQ